MIVGIEPWIAVCLLPHKKQSEDHVWFYKALSCAPKHRRMYEKWHNYNTSSTQLQTKGRLSAHKVENMQTIGKHTTIGWETFHECKL